MRDGMSDSPAPEAGPARLVVVVCVAFFAAGMVAAVLGPAIPDFARRTGAGTVAVGGALTALFAGALTGQLGAGLLLRPIGQRRILAAGMLVALIGASGLASAASLSTLLAAAGCLGLGFGTITVAGNVLAAEASGGAGPLNLVNAMFGVGAIVSPALVSLSIVALGDGIPAIWTVPAVLAAGLALLVFRAPRKVAPTSPRPSTESRMFATGGAIRVLRAPLLYTICGFAFAYVSFEASISGWMPTILSRAADVSTSMGAMVVSVFWFLMTAARFIAAGASGRYGPGTILRVCLGGVIAGAGLLLACAATGSQLLGLAAVALLGVSLGPVLPTMLSTLRAVFGRDAGVATGIMLGFGSVGGALVPLGVGALIVNAGTLAATAMMLLPPLAMAILHVLIDRLTRAARPGTGPETGPATGPVGGTCEQS
ncbi:MFS transporter [Amaricoccus sp. W119]|uniref:MFS transporter n=1 Tax=Amaricoccus sp. W119 TaxID=3391833 RepID=UPI0039A63064